jgi:Asp-tRNA(Asn)/Glu-tRNA(Gln) amidotransferase A subunit family amidase
MCFAAIGTDTAGSIREPAALCGVVGFKPTYGLVSTQGIIPLSTSLDHAGPITRSVEDAAIVIDALAPGNVYRENLSRGIEEFRIGVARKYFFEDLDPGISTAVESAISEFERMGCAVRDIEFPITEDRTVFLAESHSYHRDKIAASPELYDPETLRRVRIGSDIKEAQYHTAILELQGIRRDIVRQLQNIDVLLTPTTPVPAPRIANLTKDISQLRPAEVLLLRNTRPINVWGLPAISVPCGFTAEGLPIGLQIIAGLGEDATVLCAANAYEQATGASRFSL